MYVSAQTVGQVRVDIEPVYEVHPTVRELAEAVEQAIQTGLSTDTPEDLRNYRSPVLDKAEVDNIAEFERGLQYWTLTVTGESICLHYFDSSPNGGFVQRGLADTFPRSTPIKDIMERILPLQCLCEPFAVAHSRQLFKESNQA